MPIVSFLPAGSAAAGAAGSAAPSAAISVSAPAVLRFMMYLSPAAGPLRREPRRAKQDVGIIQHGLDSGQSIRLNFDHVDQR